MKFHTFSESETVTAGKSLSVSLSVGDVVAITGQLGAGKTAFTRGVVEGLGIESIVSSPTFTIVNEYHGEFPLFHFDMYRLENEDELYDIGWHDYLSSCGICVIEWGDRVSKALPGSTIFVTIEVISETERLISVNRADTYKAHRKGE